MTILTVDYRSKSSDAELSTSLKRTGFAVLKNHPISLNLINLAYKEWQNFFTNSNEKLKYISDRKTQDGFFPYLSENAKDQVISDLKEFYHVYPWGKIPAHLHDISLCIYNELQTLAGELLQGIEKQLPDNVSKNLSMPLHKMINKSTNTLLRILHYPPLDNIENENAVRAAAHEDINLITLLPYATAPGLEVLDINNNWHRVECDPGNIVINVGDMLDMCTENYYKSTTHRVVNPKDNQKDQSRFSMPLFLHPRKEVKLSKDKTASQYLTQRLKEIGIYK